MTKSLVLTASVVMSFASTAFASHPHQAVCLVSTPWPDRSVIQFLLQTEVSREYVNGTPEKDVHDYRYQVRICDDDNDEAHCSTYASKAISHADTDEVTLVGMKDKAVVFFRGHIRSDAMDGVILFQGAKKKTLVPFLARLDQCIAQSWVKLAPEARSNVF